MANEYAIPAEVVFTFDDEPVDIQEMLTDNAESEEVVEGLERLLKAVAAPGFTEAEVVFDIGGGVSVVRALSAKHYPDLVAGIRHQQALYAYEDARNAYQRKSGDTYYRHWTTSDTKEAKAMRAAYAVLEGHKKAAHQSRTGNPRKYVTNAEAAHLFGVSTDALGDSVKVGQTVTIETRYPNKAKNYTRTITKVTKRYLTVTDGTRYLRDTLEEDTSGSTWGIPGSAIVKIGGIRVDNPGDDGQQSLPLFGRTGNPKASKPVGQEAAESHFKASTIRALKARGIVLIGITAIPADAEDRYFSETGYLLDDNGTQRIKTYLQVLAIADGAPTTDRTGNPHGGGGLVSGYGINTFAMDPDDYAPERVSNPHEAIATMLGRPRR